MNSVRITACPGCGVESSENYDGAGMCWTCLNRPGRSTSGDQAGCRRLRLLDVRRMLNEPPPPVPWIVEPLLVRGAVTIMTGREGEGKSMLALALASGVMAADDLAGFRCEKAGVLYVDAENGDAEIARRLHGLGVPDTLQAVASEGFSLARDLAELERIVASSAPGLIVLDSLRSLWPGGDENDSAQVEAVIGPLRRLARGHKAALLLLHHLPKAGGNYRGSTALGAATEIGVTLERGAGDGDPARRLLRWWKCRPAPEPAMRWLRLAAEEGLVLVEPADPPENATDSTPQARSSVRDELAPRVLVAHDSGPLTLSELASAVGRDPKDGTVRRVRDTLVRTGKLSRRKDGRTERCPGARVPTPKGLGTGHHGTRPSGTGPVTTPSADPGDGFTGGQDRSPADVARSDWLGAFPGSKWLPAELSPHDSQCGHPERHAGSSWRTHDGRLVCGTCHPPARPDLVAGWAA